ncbi:hypothetical protein [Haemophilus parainfluenzae]|uniref:hypothetical protein n=1 Tax=Haemophilus parainfluenzae TaxID=729 RepID=UPI000DACCD14|nr:hypothetical protein [Haemophilus parainfluenzae]RDE71837.1 hypothetical protein DPV85_09475 [Haemophilus parainfluenzae]
MKVYFLKENICEYVIFPAPDDLERYFELEVDPEQNLEDYTPIIKGDKILLVEKQPTVDHVWNGNSWVIPPEKQAALAADKQVKLIAEIDERAAKIYSTWTRFESEYRERQAAAEAFKKANYQGECSRYITDFAKRAGLNNQAATDLILVQAAGLEKLQLELANQRMRKYELKVPGLTIEKMQSIHDDIIKQMDALMEAYNNG